MNIYNMAEAIVSNLQGGTGTTFYSIRLNPRSNVINLQGDLSSGLLAKLKDYVSSTSTDTPTYDVSESGFFETRYTVGEVKVIITLT